MPFDTKHFENVAALRGWLNQISESELQTMMFTGGNHANTGERLITDVVETTLSDGSVVRDMCFRVQSY